jgi:hypothetical protein
MLFCKPDYGVVDEVSPQALSSCLLAYSDQSDLTL